jgi:energy-coupling factor transport system permease protein
VNLWGGRDPRAITYFAIALSVLLVLVPAVRAWFFLPLIVYLLVTAGVPREKFAALVRAVLALWILSFVMNAFLIPGPRVGPEWLRFLRPSTTGLRAGLDHGARLAGLAGLGAWLAATTGVLELAASIEWSVRGWPWLRRQAHKALMPIVLAVRLVPLLVDEGRRLIEIERLRHGSLGKGRAVKRLAQLLPLWMVLVVERAERLAEALVLRGYDPERPRSFARGYRMGVLDWGLVLFGTLAILGVVL